MKAKHLRGNVAIRFTNLYRERDKKNPQNYINTLKLKKINV